MEQEMDEDNPTPIAMPPMTDEEGAEYAKQEAQDGKYRTTDTR